jgi:hypothetical protein
METEIKTPKECKNCKSLWKWGIKDGKHNYWCTKFGKPSFKAIGHCKNIK